MRVLARRDRFDRFVSVLVYVPRERYNAEVRAQIGDYLAEVFKGHVSAFYPFFPEGAAGARAFHHRPRRRRRRPIPTARRWRTSVGAIVRTWTDALAEALARRYEPARASALLDALPRRVLRRLSRRLFAGRWRSRTSASSKALSPERPLGVDFYRAQRGRQAVRRPEGLEPRPADPAVGARAGAGEHGLPGRRRADLSRSRPRAPTRPTSGCTTWCWSAPTAAPVDLDELTARAGSRVHRRDARRRRERRLQRAGAGGRAGWRDVALIRTISRFLRQIRVPYSQDYMWATLRKHAALAAKIVELFHARFDPRAQGATERAASARRRSSPRSRRRWPRSTASTRTASCGTSSTRCSRRSAPITISSTRTASRSRRSRSSSPAASSTACRSRGRSTKSSSIRRASRACTCASARWRAAASAGPTGRRISAPRSSAS